MNEFGMAVKKYQCGHHPPLPPPPPRQCGHLSDIVLFIPTCFCF